MSDKKQTLAGQGITGHFGLLHPTDYIKACDLLGREVTVVIDRLEWEVLRMEGGRKDRKVVVHMRSPNGRVLAKRWVVPKTVLKQIARATGESDVGKWKGKKVTMFPTQCRGAEGGMVDCIRVRTNNAAHTNEEPPDDMMAAPEPHVAFADEADDAKTGGA
jgi:hypothetical protein